MKKKGISPLFHVYRKEKDETKDLYRRAEWNDGPSDI